MVLTSSSLSHATSYMDSSRWITLAMSRCALLLGCGGSGILAAAAPSAAPASPPAAVSPPPPSRPSSAGLAPATGGAFDAFFSAA